MLRSSLRSQQEIKLRVALANAQWEALTKKPEELKTKLTG